MTQPIYEALREPPQCADDEHVFMWPVPRKKLGYAAPKGLRCQCGAVAYDAGEPQKVAHFRGQGDSTGRPGQEAGKPGNASEGEEVTE